MGYSSKGGSHWDEYHRSRALYGHGHYGDDGGRWASDLGSSNLQPPSPHIGRLFLALPPGDPGTGPPYAYAYQL